MVAASAAIPGIAGATTASTKSPKPNFSYFAGKTVTLIEPSAPAPSTIATGADVALVMGSYLHATVNVEYISVNGIVGATNEAAGAPADGLTIGVTSLGSALTDLVTGPDIFTFNFKKLEWLGAIGASPAVTVSCTPSITSWSQLVKSKTPLTFLSTSSGAVLLRSELMARMFNFAATPLTGYASTVTELVGCERGDGDFANLGFGQILNASSTAITPGFTPLLTTGAVPKISSVYSLFAAIPTLNGYLKKHPLKTKTEQAELAANGALSAQTAPTIAYFVPAGTPMPYVLALRAGLEAAYRNPTVKQQVANVPDPNTLLSASEITTWLNASLKKYGPTIQKVAASFPS
jgi:tripartite-type tricarboxylate transporter receptor subunit TctC